MTTTNSGKAGQTGAHSDNSKDKGTGTTHKTGADSKKDDSTSTRKGAEGTEASEKGGKDAKDTKSGSDKGGHKPSSK
ncbi:MAG TPA: hypothetical protein VHL57_09625 [Flavobacteriales bacterium]|jgi:hypothetical protein|nr:hypothetical protein [Flavobacteriales bacterium]